MLRNNSDMPKTLKNKMVSGNPRPYSTYLLHGAEFFLRSWLVLQLVKKFPAFLEPEGSSPYSQVPATCPYLEPTQSSPHNPLPFPEDPS